MQYINLTPHFALKRTGPGRYLIEATRGTARVGRAEHLKEAGDAVVLPMPLR